MKSYQFPFGEKVKPLKQLDQTPKRIFVLGVYASAVHAKWICDNQVLCKALAVASEPRIFWDGNIEEAKEIIGRIKIKEEIGRLEPADKLFNGPSGKVLDEMILAPLNCSRNETWLCDLLPETRLNAHQKEVIENKYIPLIEDYGLNQVTIPSVPKEFCDEERIDEIRDELMKSQAKTLVLLGDIPIKQFLKKVVPEITFSDLKSYVKLYGYGKTIKLTINKREIEILPLAHPRQIGALGLHSEEWYNMHQKWMNMSNK